ncbi:MAG: hypothetical protein R3195_17570 [Gemmatimonadota bacterium]|nr:hypothetical protein [Gemmatimonadota bacterium]
MMRNIKGVVAVASLCGGLLMGGAAPAAAQVYGGTQLLWGSDTDLGIGGTLLANIENANLEFAGSFNLFFPDGDEDFWEANANMFYHFHLSDTRSVLPYLGGGLNLSHLSNGSDNTEAGLNLGGGVRFPMAGVSPFIEARAVISDHDQAVLAFGLIFGHAHGR